MLGRDGDRIGWGRKGQGDFFGSGIISPYVLGFFAAFFDYTLGR